MGYNWAKEKMKKYLLIALLIMAGSVMVGKPTNQQKLKNSFVETKTKANEVQWWFETEYDSYDNIIGKALIVKYNTSRDVVVTITITENGKKDTLTVYVPAWEQKRAFYGNRTLTVIENECSWDYSPSNL